MWGLSKYKQNKVGPLVATYITNEWQKWIGIHILVQWIFGVNLKVFWKLCSAECTEEKNEVGPLVATNVINGWGTCTGVLDHGPLKLKKYPLKTKGLRTHTRKWSWPTDAQLTHDVCRTFSKGSTRLGQFQPSENILGRFLLLLTCSTLFQTNHKTTWNIWNKGWFAWIGGDGQKKGIQRSNGL